MQLKDLGSQNGLLRTIGHSVATTARHPSLAGLVMTLVLAAIGLVVFIAKSGPLLLLIADGATAAFGWVCRLAGA